MTNAIVSIYIFSLFFTSSAVRVVARPPRAVSFSVSDMSAPIRHLVHTSPPAVCELDGPTITGPIMSNIFILCFLLRFTQAHLNCLFSFSARKGRKIFSQTRLLCFEHIESGIIVSARHILSDYLSRRCVAGDESEVHQLVAVA